MIILIINHRKNYLISSKKYNNLRNKYIEAGKECFSDLELSNIMEEYDNIINEWEIELRDDTNNYLFNDELKEFMKILDKCRYIFSGNIRIGIPLMGENSHLCNAGLEKLDIKFDGTVLPCLAFKELDMETMKKYGIKYYNIYENLEEVKTLGSKRKITLCQKVYHK